MKLYIEDILNSDLSDDTKNQVVDKYKELACYIIRTHLSQYGITTTACSFEAISIAETVKQLDSFGYKIIFDMLKPNTYVKLSKKELLICENTKRFDVKIIRKIQ